MLTIERSIRELFIRQEKARKQKLSPILASQGIVPGYGLARILSCLVTEDGISQKEIADRCYMDTTTVSRSVDKLKKHFLVRREPNPESRRTVNVFLTDEGKVKGCVFQNMFKDYEELLKKNITQDELDIFFRVMEIMCENVEVSE